jgi:cycloartenol synthase
MQGYNGSQLWDASFAVQALISTELLDTCGPMLKKAHNFIDKTQVCLPGRPLILQIP